MLTIRACKAFSKALGEYLRQADYYSESMKVEGRSFGQLCAAVGLIPGVDIDDEAFARVASNRHVQTNEKLTVRMAAGRRAGYDCVFSAPKSVSIQAFVGGDARLLAAHETAVAEALQELETYARHQAGRGIDKRHVPAHGIAGAIFRHGESRALDPHLHSHAFVFNVTRDASGRLLALESSAIFENTRYLTEVYRHALAREVRQLGYEIERHTHGFELAGMPPELLERFSKRAQERDAAIRAREAELGRELSRDEIALLVREHRAEKLHTLRPDEVRERQLAQVTSEELAGLQALVGKPSRPPGAPADLPAAIARAAEHLFERRTVVTEEEFLAAALRENYGACTLRETKAAVAADRGLLRADGKVSTQAALELERDLVRQVHAGVGISESGMGYASLEATERLSAEQRRAVADVLSSRDRITVLRGRAGTGKTQTLATIIEGIARFGPPVGCFAPSTQAVAILQHDGAQQQQIGRLRAGDAMSAASTVQRLLVDETLQASLRRGVIVVDEYGLLSLRQLKGLADIAEKQSARLLLVGDSAQHKSVEAGDAARILERESRVRVVTLSEVHRQAANPAYRAAAMDLAAGRIDAALRRLDRMGAVVEIENAFDRRERMVQEWLQAVRETKTVRTDGVCSERPKTVLMVAPTWAEIDALNAIARHRLRAAAEISGSDRPFVSLRAKDWTRAQHKDVRNYRPGDVLVAHKATKHFAVGDELRVLRRERERLIVAAPGGERSISPRQSGLTWTACEERPLPVAAGDRVRLRAIGRAISSDGANRRLANGTTVTVQSVAADGRLVLGDGSHLECRQVAYGYALTSHAAQGVTVDKVFLAGAASHEGLYVSATRGREGIRIFVPDRREFLAVVNLRSETRTSALEFVRDMQLHERLVSFAVRAQRFMGHLRNNISPHLHLHPEAALIPPPMLHSMPLPPRTPRSKLASGDRRESPRARHYHEPSPRIRLGL